LKDKILIYLYDIKNILSHSKNDKKIFFSIINEDYFVKDEQDLLNFPMDIHFIFNETEKKYFINDKPKIIYP
jgi:hypothetical protein